MTKVPDLHCVSKFLRQSELQKHLSMLIPRVIVITKRTFLCINEYSGGPLEPWTISEVPIKSVTIYRFDDTLH